MKLDGKVTITIEPLPDHGIGWRIEWPSGGVALGAHDTFAGVRVAVDDTLRRSAYHQGGPQ